MFLQKLQPITFLCKIVGCMPFTLDKKPNSRTKATALIVALPYYVLNICCIFASVLSLEYEFDDDESKLIEITDVIEAISMSMIFFLRSSYYFFNRQQLRNIIFKVSRQNSVINVNSFVSNPNKFWNVDLIISKTNNNCYTELVFCFNNYSLNVKFNIYFTSSFLCSHYI